MIETTNIVVINGLNNFAVSGSEMSLADAAERAYKVYYVSVILYYRR